MLPAPAAGAELSAKIEGGAWERVAAVTVALTSSVAVANRAVALIVRDHDGRAVASVPAAAVQAAGVTVLYSFVRGVASAYGPVGGRAVAPAPDVFLQPGWTIEIAVAAIDAGDQLTEAVLYRERLIVGQDGYAIGGGVPVGGARARPRAESQIGP